MKKVLSTICLLAILLIVGCGTVAHGPTQYVYITSNPPGAIVTNTCYTARIKTPDIIELKRANSTILTAKLFGYEKQKKKLQVSLTPYLLGNGIGSFYTVQLFTTNDIPGCQFLFMGDMITGSVGHLPERIHFELEPYKGRIRR